MIKIYKIVLILVLISPLTSIATDWGLPGWRECTRGCQNWHGQNYDTPFPYENCANSTLCGNLPVQEWNCSQGDYNVRCPDYEGWISILKKGGTLKGHYEPNGGDKPKQENPICVDIINKIGGSNGTFGPSDNFSTFVYRFENLNGRCDIFAKRTGNEFKNAFCNFVRKDRIVDPNFYARSRKSAYGIAQYASYCGVLLP